MQVVNIDCEIAASFRKVNINIYFIIKKIDSTRGITRRDISHVLDFRFQEHDLNFGGTMSKKTNFMRNDEPLCE
jgi:hypothetical protein